MLLFAHSFILEDTRSGNMKGNRNISNRILPATMPAIFNILNKILLISRLIINLKSLSMLHLRDDEKSQGCQIISSIYKTNMIDRVVTHILFCEKQRLENLCHNQVRREQKNATRNSTCIIMTLLFPASKNRL